MNTPLVGTLVLCALALSAARADAAQITVYTNQAAWEAAVFGPITLADFAGDSLPPGMVVNSQWTGFNISGGILHDRVNSSLETTYSFPTSAVFAFAGNWDPSANGAGGGLRFTINLSNGQSFDPVETIPGTSNGDFFGFVSNEQVDNVLVRDNGGQETHDVFTLYVANPEPGTLGLFGLGAMALFGVAVRRRKRRQNSTSAA